MPPRYAYWTILIDNLPTAFRAREQADLLPTMQQLRRKNPNVVLRWFAKGRLWESPDEARGPRPPIGNQERRGKAWRPGGEHRDPRARRPPKAARPPHSDRHTQERPTDQRSGARRPRPFTKPAGEHRGPPPGAPARRRWAPNRPAESRAAANRPDLRGSKKPWRPAPKPRPHWPSAGDQHTKPAEAMRPLPKAPRRPPGPPGQERDRQGQGTLGRRPPDPRRTSAHQPSPAQRRNDRPLERPLPAGPPAADGNRKPRRWALPSDKRPPTGSAVLVGGRRTRKPAPGSVTSPDKPKEPGSGGK